MATKFVGFIRSDHTPVGIPLVAGGQAANETLNRPADVTAGPGGEDLVAPLARHHAFYANAAGGSVNDGHRRITDNCASRLFRANACLERHDGRLRGASGIGGHGDDLQLVDVEALVEQKQSQGGGVMYRFLQFLGIHGHRPQRRRLGDAAEPLDLT